MCKFYRSKFFEYGQCSIGTLQAFHQYCIIAHDAVRVHQLVIEGLYFCSSLGDGLVFPVRAQHQPSSYNSMGSTQTRSDGFLLCLLRLLCFSALQNACLLFFSLILSTTFFSLWPACCLPENVLHLSEMIFTKTLHPHTIFQACNFIVLFLHCRIICGFPDLFHSQAL